MQIAKPVGHRPRPPSRSRFTSLSFFLLSFLPSRSRNGVVAGIQDTRNELSPMRLARAWLTAWVSPVAEEGVQNSIGAAWPRRWIVRASTGGLL